MKHILKHLNSLSIVGAIGTAAIIFMIAGCGPSSTSPYGGGNTGTGGGPPANTVNMQNVSFVPNTLTITKGTTITWQNKDSYSHTSTSDTPGLWDTGDIPGGSSKTTTFNTAGTFHYHCTYHASMGMTGTIIVQ